MIEFLSGVVAYHSEGHVALDVGGVGYQVFVPTPLRWGEGEKVQLFTHLVVREDAHLLYGFPHQEERDLFRHLIEVSGIGPRGAVGMLAHRSPQELVQAIYDEDIVSLTQLPGIGKKSAAKMILELKDKLAKKGFQAAHSPNEDRSLSLSPLSKEREVVEALMALGYNQKEAEGAARHASREIEGDLSVEAWIKQSLQTFAGQR